MTKCNARLRAVPAATKAWNSLEQLCPVIIWVAVALLLIPLTIVSAEELVELANPLQGTDSVREFSRGNLYPAIAVPFPMNVWAPYTQPLPDSFYYQYRQSKVCGIRQTHQPSPWINEHAAFSFMPVSGELRVTDVERASHFSHDREVALPCYYRVYLDDHDTTIELTPTKRCASFRVTYGEKSPAYLILDAFPGGSNVMILPKERKIVGVSRYNHGGVPENFANYFVVKFDRPFKRFGTWTPTEIAKDSESSKGDHVGAYLEFDTDQDGVVTYQVASSFISHDQAERNLQFEIGDDKFEETLSKARALWNETLGLVQVAGGSHKQRRTFYSAFYRSVLFPHTFYEVDEAGSNHYYSPYDGKVHQGVMYTDSGLWDTFRAVHPLFNLLFPEINAEILQGMLNAYDESGWLPSWSRSPPR